MGPDAMIFVFWMLSFKPTFSFSSFTYNKRLYSSSSLHAIRVVSSAYLRLLIFLPEILIPACASSSPAFLVMYSAYKLWKESESEVAQSCLTLCNPVDSSIPDSSIHGILQARILEWVAISFSWESSQPRYQTLVSHIAGRFFIIWATRDALGTQYTH